jgi:competence protein ComFC
MNTKPLPINGPWDTEFTIDAHTVSSEFLGYDQFGHAQYETVRTELGELLFRCKYRNDRQAVNELAAVAAEQARVTGSTLDVVVPVPPSRARSFQPLLAIAERLASVLEINYDGASLKKVKETPELKSMSDVAERTKALGDAFVVEGEKFRDRRVLLLDDLYQSGASMAAAARAVRQSGATFVLAVALTRTRR